MEGIQVFAAYYLGNVQRGMSSLDLYSRMSSPAILSFKLLRYLFVLVILSWRVQSSYLELIVSIRSFCLCLGLIYFLFGLTSKAPRGASWKWSHMVEDTRRLKVVNHETKHFLSVPYTKDSCCMIPYVQ